MVKNTLKLKEFEPKKSIKPSIYSSQINFLYNALINKNFKGYRLENSKIEDLYSQFEELKNRPSIAKIFYIHSIKTKQIPLDTRLEFIKKIDNLHINYSTILDANNQIELLANIKKQETLEKLAKHIYEKKTYTPFLLEHKPKYNINQKLIDILKIELENKKIFEKELEEESYKLGF